MPIVNVNALKFASGPVGAPTLDVYFLDVGQGNFVIVRFPNGNYMMVDAGVTSGGPGLTAIQGAVTAIMGATKFTTVVITHPDADHNNLITSIPQADQPSNVFISFQESDYSGGIQTWFGTVRTNGGTVWHYNSTYHSGSPDKDFGGGPQCSVYVLAVNVPGDANTGSLVLSIDFKNTTTILTGDATSSTERYIMKNWDDMAIMGTILSFGHHGSSHSSSKGFLTKVSPSVGTFSASSWHMGYGHPRCILIDYVEKMVDEGGVNGRVIPMHRIDCWNPSKHAYVTEDNNLGVYLTATQGNIKVMTDGNNHEVWVDKLK